jgi:hypothetical protein
MDRDNFSASEDLMEKRPSSSSHNLKSSETVSAIFFCSFNGGTGTLISSHFDLLRIGIAVALVFSMQIF